MRARSVLLGDPLEGDSVPAQRPWAPRVGILGVLVLCVISTSENGVSAPTGEEVLVNRAGLSMLETFDLYVRSVQRGELEGLFSTVTAEEEFLFLTAAGELIDTRQGYYDFHEAWFREEGWQMPVELVTCHEGVDHGLVAAKFHYKSPLPEGGLYHLDSYFTLIFGKENGMWKVVADLCTPVERSFTAADPDVHYDEDQTYLLDIIRNRRTVRRFKPTTVPDEHIRRILDAARYAPTAGNQQPWKFLVVQDRAMLDRLETEAVSWYLERYGQGQPPGEEDDSARDAIAQMVGGALSAPVYVGVLVDSESPYPGYVQYDGALAAGYLMIAARALGYGTGFFTTFFPEDRMKRFLNIPDRYRLICFTPIGVPEAWPEMPPKKGLEEFIVYEAFSRDIGRE